METILRRMGLVEFKKLTIIVLVVLVVAMPIAPAFAKVDDSGPTSSDSKDNSSKLNPSSVDAPPTSVKPDSSTTIVSPADSLLTPGASLNTDSTSTGTTTNGKKTDSTVDPKAKKNSSPAAQNMALSVQDPTSSGIGLTPTTIKQLLPEVNQISGSLTQSYKIVVPPGRNGLQPDLRLDYNSSSKDPDNIFGAGWSINIPYIQRINKTGTEKLFSSGYFTSTMSGELVNTNSNVYKAKVENGDYLNYVYFNNQWLVRDKSGTTYKFGYSTDAKQIGDDSSQVYKWMLEEIRDKNDNYIKYEYTKDNEEIYPYKITYTGNGSTDGIFTVNFVTESRSDVVKNYAPSFLVKALYRISEINTKVNTTLVRKYTLAYTTGQENTHPFLSSVTEAGTDEVTSTTLTLPAKSFSYQTHGSNWSSATITVPDHIFQGAGGDYGVRFGDINGDGLVDLVKISYTGTITKKVWLNNGNGTWTDDTSNWTVPNTVFVSSDSSPIFGDLMDVNGDGLADIVFQSNGNGSFSGSGAYLNTGSKGWGGPDWPFPSAIGNGVFKDVRFDDVNGDGLPDLIYAPYGASKTIYTNNGGDTSSGYGWTAATNGLTFPESFLNSSGYDNGVRLADVNGDGLDDIIKAKDSSRTVQLNTGGPGGWAPVSSQWVFPDDIAKYDQPGNDNGVRLVDLNGDGLVDVVKGKRGSTRKIWMNVGDHWVDDSSNWTIPNDFVADWNCNPPNCGDSNFYDLGQRLMDVNGDGIPDWFGYTENSSYPVYSGLANSSTKSDLLSQITYPEGGTTTITYKASSLYTDGSGNRLNPNLPFNLDTVQQVVNYSGSITSTVTYMYEGGSYYFNNCYDRRFASFAKITKTNDSGNKEITYYHQGNGTNSSQGEYSDDASKIGKVYRKEVKDSSGNLYSVSTNKWDKYAVSTGRNFVKLAQTIDFTYDGNTSHKDKATTYSYDDSNGNLTQKIDYGEVTGSDGGTFSDLGTDDFTTSIDYATDSGYVIGFPKIQTTVDHSSTKVKESKYYYDAQSYGGITKGNLTKQEDWKSSSTYVNNQKTYDSTYGTLATDVDQRGKTTTYTLDSNHLYPATVTNPLSQATSYTYDYSSGQVLQKTDPNSRVFQLTYDGLDRVTAEKQPDIITPSTIVTKTAYAYTDTSGSVAVHKTDNLDGSTARESYTYFDGFNRPIQTRTEAEGSNYEVVDKVYNSLEQLDKESLPYFSSGSSKTSSTSTASLYATYTYDPMMRVTTVVNNIGTATNTYNDWKLTITDPRSKNKDLYKDAYGNLIQVDEHNSSNTYSTYYTYDYLGDLTKITDALSNIRNFTYDGLGRRLTAQDLHASADSTYGSWTYSYDDAGNLTEVVDPKSQTIDYTYDDINRQLTENYTGHAGTEVTYVYDSGTDGKGHLTSITTGTLSQTNTYNPLGGLKSESKVINSSTYTTNYDYDRLGNQLTITNPDSSVVRYNYNSAGLLDAVQRKESGGSYTDVVSNFDYSPTEQPTTISYANGATTTNTYDSTKLYRLTAKVTTIASSAHAQDLTYTYDADGNISQIIDASATDTSKTANYTYDDLNRLTQAAITSVASGQSAYTKNYTYDAIGNISAGDAGNYTYAGNTGTLYANPHAVTSTSTGSISYTYDNNGNELTKGSSLTNTWDYNNRLTQSAVSGGVTVTYDYDAAGQRIKYANGTTTTYYPSKFYNTDGTTPKKHIFALGMEVGVVNGTGGGATVRYTHTDELTGSNIITNASDTKDETLDYYPYGGVRVDSGSYSDQRKFTGHEYDADTSLSYMDARYYDGNIGRFVSQDTAFLVIGDNRKLKDVTQQELITYISDPQKLNSYSYVENNPLTKTDPTGQFSINPIGFLSNNTQISIGNWANNVAANSPIFNYVTGHKWVGYTVGGIGIAAGAGAGILYGGTVLGYTTLGQLCLFACGNTSNQIQNTVNGTQNARDALMNGTNDPQLKGIINQLYRPGASIGDGGTADALRYETQTGQNLSPAGHLQKAVARISQLNKYLGNENLNQSDRNLGQSLLNDLKDAVKSATKKE